MKCRILWLFCFVLLAGCATSNNRDPLEPVNRVTYDFNGKADRYVMKPAAQAYRKVTPQIVRKGVRNFFNNLGDASSMVNYSLQGKPEPAYYSLARFTLNSTAGIFGVMDVTGEEQRRFPQTSFGDTFARWGWKNSAYLVLPLFGPSTLRDGTGLVAGASFQRMVIYDDPHTDVLLVSGTLGALSTRARLLGLEDAIEDAALDPYSYSRDAWLQIRAKTTGDDPVNATDDDVNIDDLVE